MTVLTAVQMWYIRIYILYGVITLITYAKQPALLKQFQLFKRTLADELISVESEELDDIATNDLPYVCTKLIIHMHLCAIDRFLMIDVHLGSCWMQMPTVAGNSYSPQLRVEYLAAARHSFESFLTNCELVRALSAPEDQRWWQQWTSHSGDGAGSSRRTVSREEKIQRFRQSKALKQQLQVCSHFNVIPYTVICVYRSWRVLRHRR
jgi:hypothetical protein